MSLRPKRLAEEGVPVAAILLFWTVVSWVFTLNPTLSGAARDAGIVMAALYVVVRGARLAPEVSPPETDDVRVIVRENARVAVAAGAWFLAAALFHLVDQFWLELRGLRPFFSRTEWVVQLLAGAGLGVVALYAVAVGIAAFDGGIRGDFRGSRRDAADPDDETPADDRRQQQL